MTPSDFHFEGIINLDPRKTVGNVCTCGAVIEDGHCPVQEQQLRDILNAGFVAHYVDNEPES